MTIAEIMSDIEMFEKTIFNYSLGEEIPINELAGRYKQLVNLRNQLFSNSFLGGSIKEIETARFKIVETMLNIRILMKEKMGLDSTLEINQMKRLWNE